MNTSHDLPKLCDLPVDLHGKPLAGAALNSFLKKCKRETCEPKAVSSEGKKLSGAAKNSFMQKCEKDA